MAYLYTTLLLYPFFFLLRTWEGMRELIGAECWWLKNSGPLWGDGWVPENKPTEIGAHCYPSTCLVLLLFMTWRQKCHPGPSTHFPRIQQVLFCWVIVIPRFWSYLWCPSSRPWGFRRDYPSPGDSAYAAPCLYIHIYVYIVSLSSTFFFETVKQKSKTWYHVVSQTVSIWPLNFSARQTAGLQWGWWPTGRHSRPGLVGEVKLGIQIFHQRNVDVAWGGMLLCSWRGPGNRVDLVKIFCVPDRRAVRLRYVDGRWW